MSKQIESLKEIVYSLHSVLQDSSQKNEALKVLNTMKDNNKVEALEQSED